MQDNFGNEYARLSKLKAGDLVKLDSGFTCLNAGIHCVGILNDRLYVECDHGIHFLDGQLETDRDSLIGVYHAEG